MVVSGADTSNQQTTTPSRTGGEMAPPIGKPLQNTPESGLQAIETELQVPPLYVFTTLIESTIPDSTNLQGHGAQAITPLRAAEEPSHALANPKVHGRQQAGTESIARKVSWCRCETAQIFGFVVMNESPSE